LAKHNAVAAGIFLSICDNFRQGGVAPAVGLQGFMRGVILA
jgi:hypothetical protein